MDATEPVDGRKTLDGIPQSSAAPSESPAQPESQPSSPRPHQEIIEVNIIYKAYMSICNIHCPCFGAATFLGGSGSVFGSN